MWKLNGCRRDLHYMCQTSHFTGKASETARVLLCPCVPCSTHPAQTWLQLGETEGAGEVEGAGEMEGAGEKKGGVEMEDAQEMEGAGEMVRTGEEEEGPTPLAASLS